MFENPRGGCHKHYLVKYHFLVAGICYFSKVSLQTDHPRMVRIMLVTLYSGYVLATNTTSVTTSQFLLRNYVAARLERDNCRVSLYPGQYSYNETTSIFVNRNPTCV
jgi:hypothetical protein